MKLGLENRKKAIWAAVLGVLAILALAYEIIPFFAGGEPSASLAPTPAPAAASHTSSSGHKGSKGSKKAQTATNLDPTLQLKLLEGTEKTMYSGSGRNIFVSPGGSAANPDGDGSDGSSENRTRRLYATPGTAGAPNSAQVFWLRQPAGRTEKNFSFRG